MPETKSDRARLTLTSELFAITNKIVRRAEQQNSVRVQYDTFANHPRLGEQLFASDDQVVFGRRGSGKTHLFGWAAIKLQQRKKFALVVEYPAPPMVVEAKPQDGDGLFSPVSLYALIRPLIVEIAQNARTLATDTRAPVRIKNRAAFDAAVAALLNCADTIQFEYEATRIDTVSRSGRAGASVGVGVSIDKTLSPVVDIRGEAGAGAQKSGESLTRKEGLEQKVLDSTQIARAFADIVTAIGDRFYLFIDEWSRIPVEQQPVVAEFLKLAFCSVPNCSIKIGAVLERSRFDVMIGRRRIGIELSADAFADVNLDAWHPARFPDVAKQFLQALLFNHYKLVYREHFGKTLPLKHPDEIVGALFANEDVFIEFVEASAGVPRDAINIIMQTTAFSANKPISKDDLRRGTIEWFRTDKLAYYRGATRETVFLDWLKQRVVFERQSKGFLIEDGLSDPLIEDLRGNRVIHLVNSSLSSKNHPGRRFRYYVLDYGCYADLLGTKSKPEHDVGEGVSIDDLGVSFEEQFLEADNDLVKDKARSVVLQMREFHEYYEQWDQETPFHAQIANSRSS